MTYRITEDDLEREIQILNDYTDNKFDFTLGHAYGKCYLHAFHGKRDISNQNTKSELYHQLLTTNKILGMIENE